MDKENLKQELTRHSMNFTNGGVNCEGITLPLIKYIIDNFDDTPTTQQAWEKIAEEFEEGPKELCATLVSALPPYNLSEKPEIPKFVADWIEEVKQRGCGLADALNYFVSPIMPEKLKQWIQFDFAAIGCHHDNQELLAKAWLHGYTIEKEPVWIVKFNNPINKYWTYFTAFKGTDDKEVSWIDYDESQPNYIGNPLSHAHPFKSKDKAEAVATLTDGTVEEWSE